MPIGLLASLGSPILGQIAKPIFGNIFGRGHKLRRRLRSRRRKWEKRFLEKKNIAKKITLPNGTTFFARYERISRKTTYKHSR